MKMIEAFVQPFKEEHLGSAISRLHERDGFLDGDTAGCGTVQDLPAS